MGLNNEIIINKNEMMNYADKNNEIRKFREIINNKNEVMNNENEK